MRKFWLPLIIILAFSLRLYQLKTPLADWHSWRQADTAAVSRNFIKKGVDLLHPRFDDLSNVPSGLENPQGYRFVEFPIYNLIHSQLAKNLPVFNLVVWGRLLSISFSLVSLIFLYRLVKLFIGLKVALWAAFFFAVLPFNVFYSRVILPEPMLVMTSLGMIWFFSINRRLLAAFFAAVSFLLKPYALVLLLPIACLAWKNWRGNINKWLALVISFSISLVPLIAWRWWMQGYPEGIPAYDWLFNEGGIRFKGAWFYWLFAERLGKLILGFWGIALFSLGLVVKADKEEGGVFLSWLTAVLVYFAVIAGGNVKHDYYQIITVPIICVFLAKGMNFLLTPSPKKLNRFVAFSFSLIVLIFMLAFSWYQVRDFYHINNPQMIKAGQAADRLLPADARVIAPYGGDTAFLYQVNRPGWPVGIEIEKMVNLGATHYVNFNFGPETEWVMAQYCTLEKTEDYLIVALTRGCNRGSHLNELES